MIKRGPRMLAERFYFRVTTPKRSEIDREIDRAQDEEWASESEEMRKALQKAREELRNAKCTR